jgi:hypothetical protein
MSLRPAVWGAVEHICLNLREQDVREVWALRVDEPTREARSDLARHVNACALISPWAQTAWLDEPVAVFVAAPRSPTTVDAVFLATERWGEIARAFTRHARRVIRPALAATGVKRIEARVWARHEACRWAELLGAELEARIARYGKNGETYLQYAWTAP